MKLNTLRKQKKSKIKIIQIVAIGKRRRSEVYKNAQQRLIENKNIPER